MINTILLKCSFHLLQDTKLLLEIKCKIILLCLSYLIVYILFFLVIIILPSFYIYIQINKNKCGRSHLKICMY